MLNFQPGYTNQGSLVDDNLLAGTAVNVVTTSVRISSGQGVLARGTVLGMISTGTAAAVAAGGNTGNGTMGTVTVVAGAIEGAYVLEITAAAANAGAFSVKNPAGTVIGTGNVAAAFVGGGLSFTLADGATDFAVGDKFTITVSTGVGEWVKSLSAASNGSQTPKGILAEDIDATSADVTTVAYLTGEFNIAALTIGAAHTAESIKDGLAQRSIFLKQNLAA